MKKIKVLAKKEKLDEVLGFCHEILEKNGCDKKTILSIDLVIEEIFVNIASYAYGEKEEEVDIMCDVTENPKTFVMEFIDGGVEFDPLKKKDPNLGLKADERKIGGLGIFLSKKLTDKIEYFRKNGENHLAFQKKIN
ncbi:MAG: ATP-binding protein [Oscillospiraceae bacterium]|jgi:anti-sigma regulatory factor (Ser/Thr protein kinase)|nr:ATP-binding protein [Oscillospiraceae bacterium]